MEEYSEERKAWDVLYDAKVANLKTVFGQLRDDRKFEILGALEKLAAGAQAVPQSSGSPRAQSAVYEAALSKYGDGEQIQKAVHGEGKRLAEFVKRTAASKGISQVDLAGILSMPPSTLKNRLSVAIKDDKLPPTVTSVKIVKWALDRGYVPE